MSKTLRTVLFLSILAVPGSLFSQESLLEESFPRPVRHEWTEAEKADLRQFVTEVADLQLEDLRADASLSLDEYDSIHDEFRELQKEVGPVVIRAETAAPAPSPGGLSGAPGEKTAVRPGGKESAGTGPARSRQTHNIPHMTAAARPVVLLLSVQPQNYHSVRNGYIRRAVTRSKVSLTEEGPSAPSAVIRRANRLAVSKTAQHFVFISRYLFPALPPIRAYFATSPAIISHLACRSGVCRIGAPGGSQPGLPVASWGLLPQAATLRPCGSAAEGQAVRWMGISSGPMTTQSAARPHAARGGSCAPRMFHSNKNLASDLALWNDFESARRVATSHAPAGVPGSEPAGDHVCS